MRRWLALVLVIVMLPWQAIGWASTTLSDDNGVDERHAVAHWSGEAHHHHDDHDRDADGLHQDDSDESIQHVVHTDAHLNAAAVLPMAIDWAAVAPVAVVPHAVQRHSRLCPFLEGPRRPPRLSC